MAEEKQKKLNDWYFPPDMAACLVLLLIPLLMLSMLVGSDVAAFIQVARLCGAIGIVLLFFARWPLYRQQRFFVVGPHSLNGIHRKFYYAAYIFIVPSVFLLSFLILLKR